MDLVSPQRINVVVKLLADSAVHRNSLVTTSCQPAIQDIRLGSSCKVAACCWHASFDHCQGIVLLEPLP